MGNLVEDTEFCRISEQREISLRTKHRSLHRRRHSRVTPPRYVVFPSKADFSFLKFLRKVFPGNGPVVDPASGDTSWSKSDTQKKPCIRASQGVTPLSEGVLQDWKLINVFQDQ